MILSAVPLSLNLNIDTLNHQLNVFDEAFMAFKDSDRGAALRTGKGWKRDVVDGVVFESDGPLIATFITFHFPFLTFDK